MKRKTKTRAMSNKTIPVFFYVLGLFFLGFASAGNQSKNSEKGESSIECTDSSCIGTYEGPEFIDGADIAHQFSNTMSARVGDKLKALYANGRYSKVDFSKISMTTKGMGTGNVQYYLSIPFSRVAQKCAAYTSFDHVGGWGHPPALSSRKKQLAKALLPGEELDISALKTTPDGLQEYWIQWKNKRVQAECAH